MTRKTAEDSISKSADIVSQNIDQLKQLFPSIFTEGNIDFDALRELLGDRIETDPEYYRFTWPGKAMARAEARKSSRGTLRPAPQESVKADGTAYAAYETFSSSGSTSNSSGSDNLYIEGDNLEVLKLLQKSYAGKIKMIYIDPPYNTGKDFVYKDDYKDNLNSYNEQFNRYDEEGNLKSSASEVNQEGAARYHSNWLNMMYPRLTLARNLLTEDGVIFISLDDKEISNLMKCGKEVFGESNFVGNIVWKKKTNGNNMGIIPSIHDYLVVFSKNISKAEDSLRGFPLSQEYLNSKYSNPDNDPLGDWTTMDLSANHVGPYFSIENPKTKEIHFPAKGRYWVFNETEVWNRIKSGKIIFGKSGNGKPTQKKYLSERNEFFKRADSIWLKSGLNSDGSKELGTLLDPKIFDHPKPSSLISDVIKIQENQNGIILDFFAGSSSSAHAVMQLNTEDGGHRKHIQVQLPEPTDVKSEAFKAGYKTIAEIGKERIRRAGAKILKEQPELKGKLDVGFKVFKLDESNLKTWETDPEQLTANLLTDDVIKEDRSTQDVLYEILLKYGLDLTIPIQEKVLNENTIYAIGAGALLVCLDDKINSQTAQGILDYANELEAVNPQVVFKDSGFAGSQDKINAYQLLQNTAIGSDPKNVIKDVWSI